MVGTVVTVHWTLETPTAGYVEYGPTEQYGTRAPLRDAAAVQSSQLLGLHADQTYHFRVVAGELISEDMTFTTAPLPTALPELTFTGEAGALSGFVAVPLIGSPYAAVVLDGDGEVVWYHLLEETDTLGPRRVRVRADRAGVFFNDIRGSGESFINSLSWTGEELSSFEVADHNHDFVEQDDGSLLATVYDVREAYNVNRRGDKIVQVDTDGSISEVWSVWDDIDFDTLPLSSDTWTHANALDLDAKGGFYVGLRNFSTIVHVVPGQGIDWAVGSSPVSTYTFADERQAFFEQHQFQFLDDNRLLVFDNHTLNQQDSRVIEYQLDPESQTIEEIWRYRHDPPLSVFALGDATRFDDGSTLITWSTSGEMQLISPEGEERWRLNTSLGTAFGYPAPVASLYPDTP